MKFYIKGLLVFLTAILFLLVIIDGFKSIFLPGFNHKGLISGSCKNDKGVYLIVSLSPLLCITASLSSKAVNGFDEKMSRLCTYLTLISSTLVASGKITILITVTSWLITFTVLFCEKNVLKAFVVSLTYRTLPSLFYTELKIEGDFNSKAVLYSILLCTILVYKEEKGKYFYNFFYTVSIMAIWGYGIDNSSDGLTIIVLLLATYQHVLETLGQGDVKRFNFYKLYLLQMALPDNLRSMVKFCSAYGKTKSNFIMTSTNDGVMIDIYGPEKIQRKKSYVINGFEVNLLREGRIFILSISNGFEESKEISYKNYKKLEFAFDNEIDICVSSANLFDRKIVHCCSVKEYMNLDFDNFSLREINDKFFLGGLEVRHSRNLPLNNPTLIYDICSYQKEFFGKIYNDFFVILDRSKGKGGSNFRKMIGSTKYKLMVTDLKIIFQKNKTSLSGYNENYRKNSKACEKVLNESGKNRSVLDRKMNDGFKVFENGMEIKMCDIIEIQGFELKLEEIGNPLSEEGVNSTKELMMDAIKMGDFLMSDPILKSPLSIEFGKLLYIKEKLTSREEIKDLGPELTKITEFEGEIKENSVNSVKEILKFQKGEDCFLKKAKESYFELRKREKYERKMEKILLLKSKNEGKKKKMVEDAEEIRSKFCEMGLKKSKKKKSLDTRMDVGSIRLMEKESITNLVVHGEENIKEIVLKSNITGLKIKQGLKTNGLRILSRPTVNYIRGLCKKTTKLDKEFYDKSYGDKQFLYHMSQLKEVNFKCKDRVDETVKLSEEIRELLIKRMEGVMMNSIEEINSIKNHLERTSESEVRELKLKSKSGVIFKTKKERRRDADKLKYKKMKEREELNNSKKISLSKMVWYNNDWTC